jgi:hypothetical protein
MRKFHFLGMAFIVMLFFAFIASFEVASASTRNAFDGTAFTLSENSNGKIYGFYSIGSENYLVADNTLYKFSVNDGEISAETLSLGKDNLTADFSENKLYLYSSSSGKIKIRVCDLSNLILSDSRTIDDSYLDLSFITNDTNRNVFYVEAYSPKKLNVSFSSGLSKEISFNSKISSVLTYGDKLFVYAEGKIKLYSATSNNINLEREYETGNIPALMLGMDTYIDVGGDLCSLSSDEILFNTNTIPDISSVTGNHYITFNRDNSEGFFGVSADKTVVHSDESGEISVRYTLTENVCAVGVNGVVTLNSGKLNYYPYSSFSVRNETEESENNFPDTWNIQDGFLITNVGDSVSSLIKESRANVTYNGKEVTSGAVRTGMIIFFEKKSLTICVKGDINNTATANSDDLLLLEEYIIGSIDLDEASVISGDMNADGVLDTKDLVLFRNTYLKA